MRIFSHLQGVANVKISGCLYENVMFPNFIMKRYPHCLIEPSLRREFLWLHCGMFNNKNTFENSEANYNFLQVKIEVAFCSLKQKLLYMLTPAKITSIICILRFDPNQYTNIKDDIQ